ncbi:hypothetical protein GCM10009693_25860 [Leucobacter chromiireducens subsp. chromiireducens]
MPLLREHGSVGALQRGRCSLNRTSLRLTGQAGGRVARLTCFYNRATDTPEETQRGAQLERAEHRRPGELRIAKRRRGLREREAGSPGVKTHPHGDPGSGSLHAESACRRAGDEQRVITEDEVGAPIRRDDPTASLSTSRPTSLTIRE